MLTWVYEYYWETCLFQSEVPDVHDVCIHLWNCALWIRSQGWNFEPEFLFGCSAVSTGRCEAKTTWEVVQWRLISPPQQSSCSLCFVCAGISGQKMHDSCFASPLLPRSGIVQLFSLSKTQVDTEGKMIWWHHHDWKTIIGYTCQVQNTGLLQMFSTLVWALGSLYQVAGEVFWRGQHGISGKCRYLQENNIIQELSDHTSYL